MFLRLTIGAFIPSFFRWYNDPAIPCLLDTIIALGASSPSVYPNTQGVVGNSSPDPLDELGDNSATESMTWEWVVVFVFSER